MTDTARHRSSTLKPLKPPPARLAIPPRAPSPQSPQFCTPRPPHTGGIRAHLAHLLPRHAAFTLTLTLHQLHNVPLVHGEFGLEWKLKGVTSHSGTGILDKVKARKAKATRSTPSIAKGSDTDNASLFDAASASDAHSVANSSSAHAPSSDHASSTSGSAHGHPTGTQPMPIPAVVVSVNHPSPPSIARSISGTPSITSLSSASSMSSASNGRFTHNPPGYLSPDWSRQGQSQSSTPAHDTVALPSGDTIQPSTKLHYSPAKGTTPFVKLKEHSVVWEKTLKLVVQMSVARDNGELGDCLAKFVVMQVALSPLSQTNVLTSPST